MRRRGRARAVVAAALCAGSNEAIADEVVRRSSADADWQVFRWTGSVQRWYGAPPSWPSGEDELINTAGPAARGAAPLVLMALAVLLVVPCHGLAQSDDARPAGAGWIRPEDVPARAAALLRDLEGGEPEPAARTRLEQIKKELGHLDPDLEAVLHRVNLAVARATPFVELEDLQREITAEAAPLSAWQRKLAAEAKRVQDMLDDIARGQQVWSETRNRPETAAAGEVVARRVEISLEALDAAAAIFREWRSRVLELSDRLVDRGAAVDVALEKLRAAAAAERTTLLVPGRPPFWQSDFSAQLLNELPRVPEAVFAYGRGTRAYIERDARPLVVQLLLAILLMVGFRRLSARPEPREGERDQAANAIGRPYAVALLVALMASPALHPLAPQRFMQLLGALALLPAARILRDATGRPDLLGLLGLFVLFFADRLALALAPLPTVARASFLVALGIGLVLVIWFPRRLHRAGDGRGARRAANVAALGLALALLAELGGWANLATLLGRGILAAAILAVILYAAVLALEPLLIRGLRAAVLQRSHLFARNTAVLSRRVRYWLRWLGAGLWVSLVLRAVGMRDTATEMVGALLQAGVTVGSLSVSVGAVLAFVLTLLAAMLVARLVNAVLEEDVYPRRSLPRGMPFVLSTLVRYGVYSLGFLAALAAAGVHLSELTILLGGLSVGVGLGLQDLVKNFAAGLTLLVERRLHVGDALQIAGQDVFGRVLSIGLRATVVRSWNGSEVVVPNADLTSGAITNWTLSDRLCRVEVPVGVAYGTDPARVLALLLDAVRSLDRLLAEPAPQALFKGFGESSLDFVVRAWIDEGYEQMLSVTSELALAVHRALGEAGITIPFPQRDLHLASVSPEAGAVLGRTEEKR